LSENIHTAILEVMKQVGYVQKEGAPGLNYTFASERALIEALRPAMIEAGITMYVAATDELREGEVLTKKGSVAQYARVLLSVVFTHATSETSIRVQVPGGAMDWGDKAISKALTMAYKYALRQTFIIETGDDPDRENLVGEGELAGAATSRPPRPRPEAPKPQEGPGRAQKPSKVEGPTQAPSAGSHGAKSAKSTAQKGFSGPDMINAVAWGTELGVFPSPGESKDAQAAHKQAVRMILLKSPLLPGFSREQFEAFGKPYRALRDAGQSSGNAAAGASDTFEKNLQMILESGDAGNSAVTPESANADEAA